MQRDLKAALNELLAELHMAVGERLLDALGAGEGGDDLDPRIIKEAREFLKDNHITAEPGNKTRTRIGNVLAKLDPEEDDQLPFA